MNVPINKTLEKSPFSELAGRLGALYDEEEDALLLALFGQEYIVRRSGIFLRGQRPPEPHVMVIMDYLGSGGSQMNMVPWRSLGDFPGGPALDLRKKVEEPLGQHALEFISRAKALLPLLDGELVASMIGSDMAILIRAFPRVFLHIELSQENQEFPPEAWILYSNNADEFLSVSALLTLGELLKERVLSLLRIY